MLTWQLLKMFPFMFLLCYHPGWTSSKLGFVKLGPAPTPHFLATRLLPIVLSSAGALYFGNVAYLSLSVAFIQILKVGCRCNAPMIELNTLCQDTVKRMVPCKGCVPPGCAPDQDMGVGADASSDPDHLRYI